MNCVAGVEELLSLGSCGHSERREFSETEGKPHRGPPRTLEEQSKSDNHSVLI